MRHVSVTEFSQCDTKNVWYKEAESEENYFKMKLFSYIIALLFCQMSIE